ncbi:hypothetical protein QX776_18140 [Alteromonadaceae bacterium BrNp21-10]|nr:hypothetical protein [Alteromonadaceae bacterium BrNp21-10]
MKKLWSVIAFVGLLISYSSHALVITLSEKQVNDLVMLRFPITESYMDSKVTLSQPVIDLNAQGQLIQVRVNVKTQYQGKMLLASCTIEGEIDFDRDNKELHIKKPKLIDLQLIENTLLASNEAFEHVKGLIGQSLPVVVLIDFNQLSTDFLPLLPQDIDIAPSGLQLHF